MRCGLHRSSRGREQRPGWRERAEAAGRGERNAREGGDLSARLCCYVRYPLQAVGEQAHDAAGTIEQGSRSSWCFCNSRSVATADSAATVASAPTWDVEAACDCASLEDGDFARGACCASICCPTYWPGVTFFFLGRPMRFYPSCVARGPQYRYAHSATNWEVSHCTKGATVELGSLTLPCGVRFSVVLVDGRRVRVGG